MKKLLALVLTLAISLSLIACGGSKGGPTAGSTTPSPSSSSTTKENPLRVVYLGTKLGDNSTADAINEGAKKAAEDFGMEYIYVECPIDPAKFNAAMAEAVDQDPDIIINGSGSGLVDVAVASARDNPDIKYITLDSPLDQPDIEGLKNWVGNMAKQNECSFLVGYLAAKMSKTGKIGGIVGVEYPVLCDFIVGYIDGAKAANPNIQVAVGAIGDFVDQAKAKEIALAQYLQGADIVYAIAGTASYGILDAAKSSGNWGIGVDVDMAKPFVGKDDAQANAIMTSAIKDWGYMAYYALERISKGEEVGWGTVEVYGVANGGATFVRNDIYKKTVSEDIQKEMEDLFVKFEKGEIKAASFFDESGTSMDDATYQALKDSVKIK